MPQHKFTLEAMRLKGLVKASQNKASINGVFGEPLVVRICIEKQRKTTTGMQINSMAAQIMARRVRMRILTSAEYVVSFSQKEAMLKM